MWKRAQGVTGFHEDVGPEVIAVVARERDHVEVPELEGGDVIGIGQLGEADVRERGRAAVEPLVLSEHDVEVGQHRPGEFITRRGFAVERGHVTDCGDPHRLASFLTLWR
jgi:hypothetical protein